MEWLLRFSAQEQNYIFPVSVRSLIGAGWSAGLDPDKQGGKWKITIPLSLFPSQAHVRLRGISVTVESESSNAIFQSLLMAPIKGTVVHLDGTSRTIDQSTTPPVRVGRVQRLDSQRVPDLVGTLSLHNVSPIGEWMVAVASSSQPLSFSANPPPIQSPKIVYGQNAKINDVIVHLTLAVRNI
ncbi:hypothetical protein HDF12_001568 [Edaphobacter lichenicola]|uniref:Uncharacterized protein n=1 Tax=Tunturiibacter lichenicola TaxID=2051959 RepID=A0A7Y9NLX4_9BACT|nr:hypothetical protein [Edaphobacter lichenicola]